MSRFLYYEPCPRCQDNGKDSRGDNLAAYSDGGKHSNCSIFYCFRVYNVVKLVYWWFNVSKQRFTVSQVAELCRAVVDTLDMKDVQDV